jgi:hypothetical protein
MMMHITGINFETLPYARPKQGNGVRQCLTSIHQHKLVRLYLSSNAIVEAGFAIIFRSVNHAAAPPRERTERDKQLYQYV